MSSGTGPSGSDKVDAPQMVKRDAHAEGISRHRPFFAYPFLVITFVGWIWALVKG